jgi:ATP-dependent Clp protease ATP-binding subunit ClpA
VEKFVLQLEAQLADRGVTFELDEKATAWLAERGYDERMGARPLGRLIQEEIKKPLADEVLFGKLQKGGVVKVTVEEKPDGTTALKLETIPDENATPRERPPRNADAHRAAGADGAQGADVEVGAAHPKQRVKSRRPKSGPPRGGGSVPRVPLKV